MKRWIKKSLPLILIISTLCTCTILLKDRLVKTPKIQPLNKHHSFFSCSRKSESNLHKKEGQLPRPAQAERPDPLIIKQSSGLPQGPSQSPINGFPVIDDNFRRKRYEMAQSGDLAGILSLYDAYGVDINAQIEPLLNRPLFVYLLATNTDMAKELWSLGIVDKEKNQTAVKIAVLSGRPDILTFIIDSGFSPLDAKNEANRTSPMLSAVVYNRLEMVHMLEAEGLDIHTRLNGKSALDYAVLSKYTDSTIFDYLLSEGFQYSVDNILYAAEENRPNALAHILEHRADLATTVSGGKNLMDIAVAGEAGPEVINALLENGFKLTQAHLEMARQRVTEATDIPKTFTGYHHIADREAQAAHDFIFEVLYSKKTEKMPGS